MNGLGAYLACMFVWLVVGVIWLGMHADAHRERKRIRRRPPLSHKR